MKKIKVFQGNRENRYKVIKVQNLTNYNIKDILYCGLLNILNDYDVENLFPLIKLGTKAK